MRRAGISANAWTPIRVSSAARPPETDIAPDCRHYLGDRPCIHNRLCRGCGHYDPWSHRICIIKLGALGDVIRTLCILPELRRRYPKGHITWVTRPNGCRLLEGHPLIDRLMPFEPTTALVLGAERFEQVISLDKEAPPCALAMSLGARTKLGIGLGPHGRPVPLNRAAHEYFKLGLSDELKFGKNTLSYPQLIHEALGWHYNGERYELPVDPAAREVVGALLVRLGWRAEEPSIGINVGAGSTFANKGWPPDRIVRVITGLRVEQPRAQIILLGGPAEHRATAQIRSMLAARGCADHVLDPGTDHDERDFVALVDRCDVVCTGDTMAMHAAIARRKGVVAFFGPTCATEIDLFGNGEKLVADVPCGPCYKHVCDHEDRCVAQVPTQEAVNAIVRVLARVWKADAPRVLAPVTRAG